MSELGEEILRYLEVNSPVDSSTLASHFSCDHQKVVLIICFLLSCKLIEAKLTYWCTMNNYTLLNCQSPPRTSYRTANISPYFIKTLLYLFLISLLLPLFCFFSPFLPSPHTHSGKLQSQGLEWGVDRRTRLSALFVTYVLNYCSTSGVYQTVIYLRNLFFTSLVSQFLF